jgi:hypothetical protein
VRAVLFFVVLHPFVDLLFSVLEHAINKSSRGVRRRGDRFGRPESGSQATKLCAQCAPASDQVPGGQAQSGGRPIQYGPGPALEHLAATATIIRAQAEP